MMGNFNQYSDSSIYMMTRKEFETRYELAIKVDEFYLDDIHIFDLYKEKLYLCNTIPEMMQAAREFEFLTWGAVGALNRLSNFWVEPIKDIMRQGVEASIKEYEMPILAHILMPINMLWGGLIAEKYELPIYYAALHYVRFSVYGEGKKSND